jgi:hypothetical protein
MFDSYNDSILATLEKYKAFAEKGTGKGAYESLQIGHRNMLKRAVFNYYQAGHIKQAARVYRQLRKLYPRDEFKVPLITFVKAYFREEIRTLGYSSAKEMIQMMLRESYFRYALRDDDAAFGGEKLAREIYDDYQSRYADENRIDLPDFKLLRYSALNDFISDRQYPVIMRRNLIERIKIERPELAEQFKRHEEILLKQNNK